MNQDNLSELGLTKNELRVYEAIIKYGKLSAGEVSKFSGVSYSRIYDVLATLEQKGFVRIIPEKTKKFIPTDPKSLFDIIENKKKALDNLKEQVKNLKSLYDFKEKNPVSLGFGRSAFHKISRDMGEPTKYSLNIKFTSEYRPEWIGVVERARKKGLDVKNLVRYDNETKKSVDQWLKINKKIKKINNEGIALSIQDDAEVMIGLLKSNVTLLIKDKPFAKIMKTLFNETYKNSEEIN